MLSSMDEEILRAVGYYRYITKSDILTLFFRKTLDTYARAKLSELSGKTDLDTHNYRIMPTLCGVMRFTTIEPLSKPPSKRFGFSFQHEEKL